MGEVYVNGEFVGTVDNAKEFAQKVRDARRGSDLAPNVNVSYTESVDSVTIECGKGRARRPLIVVKDGKSLLTDKHIKQLQKNEITWADLTREGIIEFIDAREEQDVLVAFDEKSISLHHTHLEVAPLMMLGLCTSLVPFGNFNQSTRLNAGSKNQKQALGFYTSNFSVRMDMDVNLLHYPQTPIVETIMHETSKYGEHPSGINVVVAIMSYKGYNMEDAIILNKGSVDRGLARSTYYRPAVAEQLRYSGGLIDEICVPDKEVKGFKSDKDYRFLEDDGVIYPEARVEEGNVVIGKTSPPRFLSSTDEYNLTVNLRRESSVGMRHGEQGTTDFVMITENEEGNKIVQVRLREQRIPEIGDKFTSRHGQKGVVGLLVPHQDMPYSSTGVVPDLIFSPHGIPSRMTISHLLELIGGKIGSLSGRKIDGTTFESEDEESLRRELLSLGFKEDGMETMYDGITGKQYQAKIYVGNMYYMKLKHMVSNKLHSRGRGPIQLLTRQPTEGRAKEGGLRLGEMEKDTFVAHGASLLLKERFDSDKTIVHICEESGLLAVYDAYKNRVYSPIHGDNAEISEIEISYAFKLLLDELKSLGIYPKLILKDKY